LYLKAGEHELAKEAFTRSRSVDPSLALTWAAMANMCDMSRQYVALCYYSSVKINVFVFVSKFSCNQCRDQMQEAYANILYAAQLLPVS
jgi:AraC-like DNA-binding protein